MIEIDNTITSLEVIETPFYCDLDKCKGACCVEGDSGAPLEIEEIQLIEQFLPIIEQYLPEKSKKLIKELGFYYIDNDGDRVTQLHNNKECVFVYFENDIALCAIEKAHLNNHIPIQKPISCHLYPIRLTPYSSFTAINYHSWDICIPARIKGKEENTAVYQFCKEPLCKKFGKEWFEKLLLAVQYINQK